jgi:hypothetical protein
MHALACKSSDAGAASAHDDPDRAAKCRLNGSGNERTVRGVAPYGVPIDT